MQITGFVKLSVAVGVHATHQYNSREGAGFVLLLGYMQGALLLSSSTIQCMWVMDTGEKVLVLL